MCSCLPIMAFLLIAPNLPAIQKNFEAQPNIAALAPIALTIPALMIAILSAPAGFLADRLGRRQVLIGSLVVYLIAGTAPAFLNTIGAIIVAPSSRGIGRSGDRDLQHDLDRRLLQRLNPQQICGPPGGEHFNRFRDLSIDRRRAWRTRLACYLLGLCVLPRLYSSCLHRGLEPGGDTATRQRHDARCG